MLYSALASSGLQLQRQLASKSWLGALGPDCHLRICYSVSIVYLKQVTASWKYQILLFEIKNTTISTLNINFKISYNINELTALDERSNTYSKLATKTTIEKVKVLSGPFSSPKMLGKSLKNRRPLIHNPSWKKIIPLPFFLDFGFALGKSSRFPLDF